MKVTVAIDVASLAHAIGARSSNGHASKYVAPQLASLLVVLKRRGMDVEEFQVAVPVYEVQVSGLVVAAEAATRTWAIRQSEQWIDEQRYALRGTGVALSVLSGAHDGSGEVGVDVVLVCGVLIAAAQIASGVRSSNAIVVITHDSDLFVVARAAQPTTVIIAGNFDKNARRRLASEQVPFLRLSPDEIAVLDTHGDAALLMMRLGMGPPVDQHEHVVVMPAHLDPPRDVCVVIADPYGLACSSMAALGDARLPTMASIRRVLSPFGVHADSAILATIPDVEFTSSSHAVRAGAERRSGAWHDRDDEVDGLALQFDADGDDDTRATRARLPLRRVSLDDHSFGRGAGQNMIKQLATQMVSDIYRCLLKSESQRVVVLTDSVDVTWALHMLAQFGLDPRRILRVGAHKAPVQLVVNNRPKLLDVRTSMLTKSQLIDLMRGEVTDPTAPDQRAPTIQVDSVVESERLVWSPGASGSNGSP